MIQNTFQQTYFKNTCSKVINDTLIPVTPNFFFSLSTLSSDSGKESVNGTFKIIFSLSTLSCCVLESNLLMIFSGVHQGFVDNVTSICP